jgi:hypothetical protein
MILDRVSAGLTLPAREGRAVISHDKFDATLRDWPKYPFLVRQATPAPGRPG